MLGSTKSEDATHFATDGPAPRRYDGHTPRTVRCVPVFVRSEKSNALVGDGFLQPAPRSANLDSAFAYCAAVTAVTAMGSPSLALSHLCCGLVFVNCSDENSRI
ncbi:hypothetical protein EMIHUDRAFT_211651 [Emiliania huxleyi CCMP1516]|uniref:Uncharacterized protein n=2 Tax=Emiliania huxleyi TaxID=2903 RepID=A0A0D3IVZ9_EMIH1|nr:hypothetical protein EMIHUDRAFT_211651 [Emiliania huxleyi CCMP1516]EOD15434.1 hypothetical protein EMIHUDRAFT_211651 [Emiliania huxleyi CCMP1516]|eukprot:XP_005767863.1 hypothetical protein EMIHUDRAFT_211651 [Emiliania huxleyi CCMP1516]